MMGNSIEQKETFHLGLTMAGAVSAGAYTGGVMDYLFEVLDKWEKAKKAKEEGLEKVTIDGKEIELKYVPEHNVVIDAIGGTSAGGMTTVMAALYAIKGEINPVTDPGADMLELKNNMFYDSWVRLVDEKNGDKTLEKALNSEDLTRDKKVYSFLNSDFIEEIAKQVIHNHSDPDTNPIAALPSYISKDLEMLISHTMLRGVPLEVSFATPASSLKDAPSHVSYEHFLFSHFKLNHGVAPEDQSSFWLNPYDSGIKEHLINATMATGAFPVGLKYREFDKSKFGEEYLKTVISRLVKGDMGETPPELIDQIDWEDQVLNEIISNYKSVTVDGGAINNEPYGEVLSILKARHKKDSKEQDKCQDEKYMLRMVDGKPYYQYGMIMIDPFPDFPENRKPYEHPDDLVGVVPATLATLRDQSKIKRREMLNQFRENVYRGVIYPVKRRNGKKQNYPIASASLVAFGGFLDIRFRHHDYFLGRNNARNFVRSFLSMPYEPEKKTVHPMHTEEMGWTPEVVDRFLIKFDDGSKFLPVIPDMNMILDEVKSIDEADHYSVPDLPVLAKKEVDAWEPKLTARIMKLADTVEKEYFKPKKIEGNWFQRIKQRIKRRVISYGKKKLKAILAEGATEKAMGYIHEDLIKRGLMPDDKKTKNKEVTMDWLERDEAKAIVETALRAIADWEGDFEDYLIGSIQVEQMLIFLHKIQEQMNEKGLFISLTQGDNEPSGVYAYETMGDLIDYIYNEQAEA